MNWIIGKWVEYIYKHTHTHSNSNKPTKSSQTKMSTNKTINNILSEHNTPPNFGRMVFFFASFNLISSFWVFFIQQQTMNMSLWKLLKSFSIFLLHFAINFYFHQKYQTIDIVLDYFNNNKELAIVKFGIFGGLVKRVWINLWLKINYVVIKYKYQQHGNSRYI